MIEQLMQALQSPTQLGVLLIQFSMGFGLGYISVKALKYVLGFIGILVLGVLLNVWSLGLLLEGMIAQFGEYAMQAKDLIYGLMSTLGLLTIGPTTMGFVMGALVAWLKK